MRIQTVLSISFLSSLLFSYSVAQNSRRKQPKLTVMVPITRGRKEGRIFQFLARKSQQPSTQAGIIEAIISQDLILSKWLS
jgi:hypothetical protein